MDESVDIDKLVHDLAQEDDSTRKKAAFKLQNLIGDPSFADTFITSGGVPTLRFLALRASGNTLAYSLASLSNLLNLDQGWAWMNSELVHRLVNLVVSQPLVNISRGAMSILASIVSHPSDPSESEKFGFSALKPALDAYPEFLETLAGRLSSADHSLCQNALQLLNAILRDSMANDSEHDWDSLFKKYNHLGVVEAVHFLMQDPAVQDLAHSLLDFQSLVKQLMRKWKGMPVDLGKQDHRRQLKAIFQASKVQQSKTLGSKSEKSDGTDATTGSESSKARDPDKWRRLGFQSESPVWEFEEVGLLGLRDLNTFAFKSEDAFQRLLQEQLSQPREERCPLARASLSMTSILYDHFDIQDADPDESHQYVTLESRSTIDKLFRPLMLQWRRLHTAGIQAFVRIWSTAGAKDNDFIKIEELIRILLEASVGVAPVIREIAEVEHRIATYELHRLREDQMGLLELTHEEAWGHHLRQVKSELHSEALQFIKEQRIRCCLQGSWFPNPPSNIDTNRSVSWRYARVSHNRRYLHYDDFDSKTPEGLEPPSLDSLEYKVDLSSVSSVVSNVTPSSPSDERSSASFHTRTTGTGFGESEKSSRSQTQIHIHGYSQTTVGTQEGKGQRPKHHRKHSSRSTNKGDTTNSQEERLLTLNPPSQTLASEWLDGLLFLLGQPPITNETTKLVEFIAKYGLKIRLLNVRYEEGVGESGVTGDLRKKVKLPAREGVDEDYYYDVAAF